MGINQVSNSGISNFS